MTFKVITHLFHDFSFLRNFFILLTLNITAEITASQVRNLSTFCSYLNIFYQFQQLVHSLS